MQIKINPSIAKGFISAPPSKSMAHRLLICSALAGGTSIISNIAYSQDILATMDCIRAMGADVVEEGNTLTVTGNGGRLPQELISFPCRESGSTMRFFMGISMLSEGRKVFLGSETLRNRPFSVYEEICKKKGISFVRKEDSIEICGSINAGDYVLPGDVSSQFITGLLFVLPMLDGDSSISLTGKVESRSYIDLTLSALADFGVQVSWKDERTLVISGNQKYQPRELAVEGDYSNAAFLDALNVIGGQVEVNGLRDDSLQGDRIYRTYYPLLDHENAVLDLSDCPDLGPILFALAAAKNGAIFTGTRRLKMKESDRGTVMCAELAKFGVRTKQEENEIIIYKSELKTPTETVCGHNDHRIVMSMATLLSITGGVVDDAQAVRKSYPDYFSVIKSLGIEVEEIGMDQ